MAVPCGGTKPDPCLVPYTQINSKEIEDINVKTQDSYALGRKQTANVSRHWIQ